MPSNVRAFWWINVGLIAYSAASALWFLIYPTPFPGRVIAVMGAQWVRHAQLVHGIQVLVIALLRGSIILTAAWFAAFRHLGWARWVSILLLIISYCLPVAVTMRLGMWRQVLPELLRELADWRLMLIMFLWMLSLIFVFTGNARPWFRGQSKDVNA